VAWVLTQDIVFNRSRPCKKNDKATVELKNNHVVRKQAFYWRYDVSEERELLNELWRLMSLRLNFFTSTNKPTGFTNTAGGRGRRTNDIPESPWQHDIKRPCVDVDVVGVEKQIAGINPSDMIREITLNQHQLTQLAAEKTQALSESRKLDMTSFEKSNCQLQLSN